MTGSQAHYRAFELNWHCQGLAIPELPGCSMEALAGADPLIAIEPEEPDHWPQIAAGHLQEWRVVGPSLQLRPVVRLFWLNRDQRIGSGQRFH